MNKSDLAKLAMIGISAGMMVTSCQQTNSTHQRNMPTTQNHANNGHTNGQMSPETRDFYDSLSDDAKEQFNQLDAQHKMMAMEMMHQSCNGKNACKGQGGCETARHDCAGKNACKGQGGPPVDSPEKAVKAQYDNQMGERHSISQNIEAATVQAVEEPKTLEETATAQVEPAPEATATS